jgi:hypothetical protein
MSRVISAAGEFPGNQLTGLGGVEGPQRGEDLQ